MKSQIHTIQKNSFKIVSKSVLRTSVFLLLTAIAFTGCQKNDDGDSPENTTPPTAMEFKAIQDDALESIKQHFTFEAGNGTVTLTSEKGVTIHIPGDCLTLNGNPVTGTVDLEYAELFDRGTMLVTNKPTMGRMPNGDLGLLISGGEFYINAKQSGQQLAITCSMSLVIPGALTDGVDNAMLLWNGAIDEEGNLVWDRKDEPNGTGGVGVEGTNYYAFFADFGWTNVDRFYNDPRPKTTILVDVPEGFNNENSEVFLSYDGEGSALARLDTYTAEGLFSEHYGQIPIGLACHVIFVTEENGEWRYAIKAATIAANDIITFSLNESTTGSQAELIAAINAVQ